MTEQAALFGPHGNLLGIVTHPSGDSQSTAFVVLNAGMVHSVGPNRISVTMARALAFSGFPVLRFDLSGLGDSAPRIGEGQQVALEDIEAAIDYVLKETNAAQVVLLGLCSGAFNTFSYSQKDPRVVGAVMIDGYAYPTIKSMIRRYSGPLLNLGAWGRACGRLFASVRRKSANLLGVEQDDTDIKKDETTAVFGYVVPNFPKSAFEAGLRSISERGVCVKLIYSGLMDVNYNYESQYLDWFADNEFLATVDVSFYPDANHTFTEMVHMNRMRDEIVAWSKRNFSSSNSDNNEQQAFRS